MSLFIFGKAAIAEGIGEILSPVTPTENYYLLAIPSCHVSTPLVFGDPELTRDTRKQPHQRLMQQAWENDCQTCVKNNYPEVAKIIEWLVEYAPTRLTGTGGCVFSTFNNASEAQVVMDKAPKWLNIRTTQGLNNSPLNELLSTLDQNQQNIVN
ncbi:hypothetical protein [Psychromonas sp. MME2]|uniref:4-(cytidine 5'-diphospho)-2-C-methyl-D-erythritol kinase n=1 Tax=Psychromonas sp. MME2 TaxID=3231033 RepID=UPI00339BC703